MATQRDSETVPLVDAEAALVDEQSPKKRQKLVVIAAASVSALVLLAGITALVVLAWQSAKPLSAQSTLFAHVQAARISALMKNFSTLAHIAGSPQDKVTAQWTEALLLSWGYVTRVIDIPVMLSYPEHRSVSVVFPEALRYNCTLQELPMDDGTEGSAIDTWNGYSASGEATGELVYANYEDYLALDKLNVSLEGKIVIVRYGQIYRGNKAKFAMDRKAAGVLIYVDPGDTGDVMAKQMGQQVFPAGPWSTNTTVQRGTVWLGEGDPSTPGWPSTWTALPSIPVQPLSYGDAWHLLQGLQGLDVPNASWAGGFNLTKLGPGPVKVHMNVSAPFNVTPIWDVVATLKGSSEPDHYVLLGCHRDAWTFGAADPISGHSILLETAHALSELTKTGWRPKRSIIFLSWDAEEFALVGSVELLERRLGVFGARSVSYLNLDVGVSVTATPSLYALIRDTASAVPIPSAKPGGSARVLWDLFAPDSYQIPGTGSDHTGFAHHAGIPIAYLSLADGDYESVYHSNYDSYYWMSHFGDPSFEYHAAMSKLYGALAIRLASDATLPLNYSDYSEALDAQIALLVNFTAINATTLSNAVSALRTAARATASELEQASAVDYPSVAMAANRRLMLTERCFLNQDLSPVPWFWHVLWTPSPFDSYAGGAFYAVYNAAATNGQGVHDKQFVAERIAQVIEGAADFLAPDYFFS